MFKLTSKVVLVHKDEKRRLMVYSLSDKELFDSYEKAIELNLDKEFIQLLEQEIKDRNLMLPKSVS